jgi:uncharacterized protein (DUF427 family)
MRVRAICDGTVLADSDDTVVVVGVGDWYVDGC